MSPDKTTAPCQTTAMDEVHHFDDKDSALGSSRIPLITLSPAVEDEIYGSARNLGDIQDPTGSLESPLDFASSNEVRLKVQAALSTRPFCLVKAPRGHRSLEDYKRRSWLVARSLGEPVSQDNSGRRLVEVFDRKQGRIGEGARYHQTRDAGEIHNDNVNTPETFHYLVLGCGRKACLGGVNILVQVADILRLLKARAPDAVAVLCQSALFEKRGMSSTREYFEAPILNIDGPPQIRYLRSYIEGAYRNAKRPLPDALLQAMDCLDAAIYSPETHVNIMLEPGDILVAEDLRVLHGRTPFQDVNRVDTRAGRIMFRIWCANSFLD